MNQENIKTQKEDKLENILDVLNNMLTDTLQRGENIQELKKIKVKNTSLIQVFADNIDIFSENMIFSFFSDVHKSIDAIMSFLQKDPNEIWKFFNFCFTCLNNISHEKQTMLTLFEVIKEFGQKNIQKDPIKIKNIFLEYFLP